MHHTRKRLVQITEGDRQQESEIGWQVAALTIVGALVVAVAVTIYPLLPL